MTLVVIQQEGTHFYAEISMLERALTWNLLQMLLIQFTIHMTINILLVVFHVLEIIWTKYDVVGEKSLLELCIQSRLRILNGRSFGDTMGRFTAHCSLGSSVIFYFIASEDIQINSLVFTFMNLRNHYQIIPCYHAY